MERRNCSHGPQFKCGCRRPVPGQPSAEMLEEQEFLRQKRLAVEEAADATRRSYALAEKAADAMLRYVGEKRMTSRRLK